MKNLLDLQSFWITSLCSSNLERTKSKNLLPQQQQKERSTKCARKDTFGLQQQSLHSNCNNDADYQQQHQHQQRQQQPQQQQFHYHRPESLHHQQQQQQQQQSTLPSRLQHAHKSHFGGAAKRDRGLLISETQFIGNSAEPIMDDMVFQYNNQNSIYVLNSNYSSYGEFARLNLLDPIGVQLGALPIVDANAQRCQQPSSRSAGGGGGGCVSVPQNLKYKLNTSGNFNRTASEAIGNPVASSMSAATCSPAAAALQKLFNCSSVANNMSSCNSSNSNNSNNINRDRDCLSTTEKNNLAADAGALCGNISTSCGSGSCGSRTNNNIISSRNSDGGFGVGGGGGGGKKKCSNVKSTLIAKKTKFWKFLEEEKLRTSEDSVENVAAATTTNICERRSSDHNNSCAPSYSSTACRDRACMQTTTSSSQFPMAEHSQATQHPQEQQQQQQQQQHKSNNWSGSHNNGGSGSGSSSYPQHKSSHELYKEAAELLGLSCTLCDNCRCLDCQSGYFDCDDSDSYSEFSLMDEYDEEEEEDVGTAAATATTTAAIRTTNTTALMMHANNYDARVAATSYSGLQQQKCTDTNCNMADDEEEDDDDEEDEGENNVDEGDVDNSNEGTATIDADAAARTTNVGVVMARNESELCQSEAYAEEAADDDDDNDDYGDGDDDDAAKQTTKTTRGGMPNVGSAARLEQSQRNELENCASFNELSLVDAEQQQQHGMGNKCVRH